MILFWLAGFWITATLTGDGDKKVEKFWKTLGETVILYLVWPMKLGEYIKKHMEGK